VIGRRRWASIAVAVAFLTACGENGSNGGTTAKTPASSVVVTFDGLGRARIGTSAAQLREIGSVPRGGSGQSACRVVTLDWLPAGVRVLLVNDSVARIDVDSTSAVRTIDGAGVGDPETRIHQFYSSIETQPHKYVANGHVLIVASPNDSSRRIVFETDGNTVKRYRVGRRPEVDFVEGCG
jgi:hypothetical protein